MSERESRSKRQRTSDIDYRERKRSKRDAASSPESPDQSPPQNAVQRECRRLYQEIKELEDPEDGHLCCDLFLQPPSRRQYPDYYEMIKTPIALNNIKAKIDKIQYASVDEFKADIELMVTNAKKYNVKESYAYQDAKLIKGKSNTRRGSSDAAPEPVSKSATIKLPALAFGNKPAAAPVADSKIKSIKLKTSVKSKPTHTINELMDAIGDKNTKLALEILDSEPSFNVNELVSVDMFNETFTWSPLHAAAYYGETKVIRALMAHNAQVDIHDTWYSGTPLAWAAFGDRDKAATLLVEKYNANKKAKNIHGQIPLDLVSDRDDPRWAGVLTSAPLKPSSKSDTATPEPVKRDGQSNVRRPSEASSVPASTASIRPELPSIPYPPVAAGQLDPIALMRDVFKNVRNHTDQYGRLYSEIFEEDRMASGFYPSIQAWEADITQIFLNAMAFAENSSRLHKDAKLLHRLYFRMKERYLAKIKVGPSEERQLMVQPLPPWHGEPIPPRPSVKNSQLDQATIDAAFGTLNMRNSLKNRRHNDNDILDTYNPPPYNPQRPPLAALQMTQPTMPSYSDMPYGVPQYNKPVATSSFGPPQSFTPPIVSVESPMPTPAIPFQSPPPPPVQQLQQMQAQYSLLDPDVARLFESPDKRKAVRLLNGLQIESVDKSFVKQVDGQYFAHSILIGPQVHTLKIRTDLLPPLKQQTGRIVVQAAYNHRRLQPTDDASEWVATPLAHGLNVVSVTVTIDVTPSSSPIAAQDIEAQTYTLFITRNPQS
ncbi:hypothetical protein Unana1_08623 [Umbelopsis nana]